MSAEGEEKDIEQRRELLQELVNVRQHLTSNDAKLDRVLGFVEKAFAKQEQHDREFGRLKSHLTEQALAAALERGVEPNGIAGRRVLVVEDETSLLTLAERALRGLGCAVHVATNRTDAERLLASHAFDAALIDLHIPESRDGLELVRWVSRMHKDTRVILMSGIFEAPELEHLPVVIRMEKPFTLQRLHGAIEEAVAKGGPATVDTVRPPAPQAAEEFGEFEATTLESVRDDEPDTNAETPEALAAVRGG